MYKDYYDILGVSQDVDEKQIKLAYRQLAKQWHPDINKTPEAEQRFKDISEAYNVLSDAQKRQQYDTFGATDANGVDPFDFVDSFFHHRQPNKPRGRDIVITVELTIDDNINGCTKTIEYNRPIPCQTCEATGSRSKATTNCSYCGGTGMQQRAQQMGMMRFLQQIPCQSCNSTGKFIKDPCTSCFGRGVHEQRETLEQEFQPGCNPGLRLCLRGKGEQLSKGAPGDLILDIILQNSSIYQVDKDHLVYTIDVDYIDLVLGATFNIPLPGKSLTVPLTIKRGTPTNKTYTLTQHGLALLVNNNQRIRTDLIVRLNLNIPMQLSDRAKQLLQQYQQEIINEKANA